MWGAHLAHRYANNHERCRGFFAPRRGDGYSPGERALRLAHRTRTIDGHVSLSGKMTTRAAPLAWLVLRECQRAKVCRVMHDA